MKYFPTMNDMFRDFFDDSYFNNVKVNSLPCDIKETETNYEMAIEVPGYDKDNITIDLENGYLTVAATKNTENEESDDNGRIIRRERYSGSCSRRFYVGNDYTVEDIDAQLNNGELVITLPKEAPKRIEEKKQINIR